MVMVRDEVVGSASCKVYGIVVAPVTLALGVNVHQ